LHAAAWVHFPRHWHVSQGGCTSLGSPFVQHPYSSIGMFPKGARVAAGHGFQGRFVQQDNIQIRHGFQGHTAGIPYKQGSVQQNSVQAGCKSQGRLHGNLGRFLICGCMVFKAVCCGMILEICELSTSSLIAVIISEFFSVGHLNKNLILLVFPSGFCPGVFTQKLLCQKCVIGLLKFPLCMHVIKLSVFLFINIRSEILLCMH
jgi:hypothetical protein